jgi:hypothetical protein
LATGRGAIGFGIGLLTGGLAATTGREAGARATGARWTGTSRAAMAGFVPVSGFVADAVLVTTGFMNAIFGLLGWVDLRA